MSCIAGFYNPGFNTRACTRCPGGLTTTAPGATSPADCVAPAGSYYLRGKSIPCAQGTFKAIAGNADCTRCPDGTTTAFGTVGATNTNACICEWLVGPLPNRGAEGPGSRGTGEERAPPPTPPFLPTEANRPPAS